MRKLLRRVAGLDVHAKSVEACVRVWDGEDREQMHVRRFGTMTGDLRALSAWLGEHGVTHVAMESTGVYWKPIFNVLEEGFALLLCNARHIKHVPGRKTDVKDCQWIAQLLQCGLLTGSFIPPRAQRDLRDLTRHRAQLTGEATRVKNRIQKILEDANVKLAEVASDPLGVSGRLMLKQLVAGQTDPKALAELAQGRLRAKTAELRQALESDLTDHHRFMLAKLLRHLEFLEQEIEDLDRRIESALPGPDRPGPSAAAAKAAETPAPAPQPEPLAQSPAASNAAAPDAPAPLSFPEAQALLCGIAGVQQTSARAILAEIGTNMAQFPSAKHLASWARLCPGNDESAGKRRSGKTGKANRWLRRVLVQCAWAATRCRDAYFAAQFRQIAKRRGKKRALIAVAHSMLTVIHQMLKFHLPYQDLGGDFFDTIDPVRKTRYHVKRLEELGYKVIIEAAA